MDRVDWNETREAPTWRVPALGPRAVRLYRFIWFALLLVAIAANAAAPYFHLQMRKEIQQPFSDLGLRQFDGRKLQVPHRPSLERAGVVAGSEIVAIGGRPIAADSEMLEIARLLKAEASPVPVTIRMPDGTVRDFRLPRNPAWIELSYSGTGLTSTSRVVIDLVFAAAANLALLVASALLFWRRPSDGLAVMLSLAFLGFAAFENLTWYTWQQLGLLEASGVLFNISFALMLIGLMLCPDGRFQPAWSRWVAIGIVITFALTYVLEAFGVPEWQLVALAIASFLFVLPAMRSRFRQTPVGSEAWQQQRWLVLGMSLAAVAMLFSFGANMLVRAAVLDRHELVWGYLLSGISLSLVPLFAVFGMLVALLRYRLYDAEAALSRSAGLAIIGLTFAALFAGFAKAIEIAIERSSGESAGAVPEIAAAVLATVLVTPAQSRIQAWTDERFRKALSHLRRDLPACVEDLRETASLTELLDEILARVCVGVRASSAAVMLDGRIAASRGPIDLEWPLRLPLRIAHGDGTDEGELLIGNRPDGSLPSRDERDALADVVDPVSRAIRVVRTREAREQQQERRWAALETRIARLEGGAPA